MLKVLQIGKYYPPRPGGIEYFVKTLLQATASRLENHAVVADKGRRHRVEAAPEGTVHHRREIGTVFLTPILPGLFWYLHVLRKKHRFDCIVLHVPNPMTTLSLAISDLLVPMRERLVIFYHADIVVDSPVQRLVHALFRPVQDRVFRKAARFVAHSPNLIRASPVLSRFAAKTEVIPSAVPDDLATVTEQEKIEAQGIREAAGKPVVLFVGRLVAYKGLNTLIGAVPRVPSAMFLIVGEGPLETDLKRRAAELGVSDRVAFVGRAADLKPYYLACDVFVLPADSPLEAFGLVQVEAMSFGKPVVTSDLPTGVTYVNLDGKTGLTFPVGDAEKLADALNRLLPDEPLRRRLGEFARARAEKEFTASAVGERFVRLVEDLCEGGRTP